MADASKIITNVDEALQAVKKDGLNYFDLNDDLQENTAIIKEAIKSNYYVYTFLSDKKKHNEEIKQVYLDEKNKIDKALNINKSSIVVTDILNYQLTYLNKKYESESNDISSSLKKQIILNKIIKEYCSYIKNIDPDEFSNDEKKEIIRQIENCNVFIKDDLTELQDREINIVLKKLNGTSIDDKVFKIRELTHELYKISEQINALNKKRIEVFRELNNLREGTNTKI